MITEDDRKDMRVRVALLEASHIDLTTKVGILIDGFNHLNVNLSTLISSINIVIRVITTGITIIGTLTSLLWGYHSYMTAQIEKGDHHYEQIHKE